MHSREIQDLLEHSNYKISSEVYKDIIVSSNQIDHVKYNPSGEYFQAWTDDGYQWQFDVVATVY